MPKDLYRETFRRGLFDFHAGDHIEEVVLHVQDYFAAASKAGIQTITFMTKDSFGTSYYDTKAGYKNTKITGDFLAEATKEAEKHGIDLIAYYNVGLNSYVANANPDYRQRNAAGEPVTEAYDYYDLLCMNSPYRDFVYAQIKEIATQYNVAGFFFDITYVWEDSCYCEYCRSKFQTTYGKPIPESPEPGTEEMAQWQAFRRDIRYKFLRDMKTLIGSINPDLLIGWNHAGDIGFAQVEVDEFADYFTSEFHPPQYANGSLLARWKRSFDKPFELMMPSEMGSWGEWTVAPAETMKTTAAIAVANGGSISFGHVVYPSGEFRGQLPKPVMEGIGQANQWVQSLEPWLLHAKSVPTTAVLYSIENRRMMDASGLPQNPGDAHIQGLHRILTEGSIHYDFLNEQSLLERINEFEVLILPDQAYLNDDVLEHIRHFVRNGGRVLATNRTSLYNEKGERRPDFALADLFGVHFSDVTNYSVSYLYPQEPSISQGVPDMPILLKDSNQKMLRVTPDSHTKILSNVMDPAVEAKTHRHVYHQHAHPAKRTPYPAVTMAAYGKGQVVYIAGPIESAYWETGSPWLRKLYVNSLSVLQPQPFISVDAPLSVEVNVMQNEKGLVVHLVHVREEIAAGSSTFIEEIAPVRDIHVRLKMPAKRVYTIPDGQDLPYTMENNEIHFTVPEFILYAGICVEPVS